MGHTAEQHSHGRPPGRNYGPVERGVNRQSSAPNGQISAPVGQPSAPQVGTRGQSPILGPERSNLGPGRSNLGPARRGQPSAPHGAVNLRPRTARTLDQGAIGVADRNVVTKAQFLRRRVLISTLQLVWMKKTPEVDRRSWSVCFLVKLTSPKN